MGKVLPSSGTVAPGDVVAVTMFANQVYTGVGGDKFGIELYTVTRSKVQSARSDGPSAGATACSR